MDTQVDGFLEALTDQIAHARVEYDLEFRDSGMSEDEFVALAIKGYFDRLNSGGVVAPLTEPVAGKRKRYGSQTLKVPQHHLVDSTHADQEINKFLYTLDKYAASTGAGGLPMHREEFLKEMRRMVYNMLGALRTKATTNGKIPY